MMAEKTLYERLTDLEDAYRRLIMKAEKSEADLRDFRQQLAGMVSRMNELKEGAAAGRRYAQLHTPLGGN